MGISYLQSKNRVWLLNSWQLEIIQPTILGDDITVGTWPYDFKGFYGYRNFIIKNKREEVIAVANSIWIYLDTETGKPVKVPKDMGYIMEPPYPMEYADRKVDIGDSLEHYPSFQVKKLNIDSYNHVNNGQYIKLAEEYLPPDFSVHSMRVEYRMQAVLGDMIHPLVSEGTDCIKIVLNNSEGKPYSILEFKNK